jgi:hypothetical protein
MKRAGVNLLVVVALLMASVSVASASPNAMGRLDTDTPTPATKGSSGIYVVQLLEAPVVDYKGDIVGYAATEVRPGEKLDKNDPAVIQYAGYLDQRHDAVLGAVGGTILYDYRYTYNGFAAALSPEQAEALQSVPGVLAVTADEVRYADTSSTPGFLGLTAPGGLWEQLGGPGCGGEDIVIGIIDSGIWPESASFAADASDGIKHDTHCNRVFSDPAGKGWDWAGACQTGEEFAADDCSNKLIGARYYNESAPAPSFNTDYLPQEISTLGVQLGPVPEPSALIIACLAVPALAYAIRRHRRVA